MTENQSKWILHAAILRRPTARKSTQQSDQSVKPVSLLQRIISISQLQQSVKSQCNMEKQPKQ